MVVFRIIRERSMPWEEEQAARKRLKDQLGMVVGLIMSLALILIVILN